MKLTIGMIVGAATMCCLAMAQGRHSDPYEILNRHFAASGGLERLKAERGQYIEGTLALAGLNGSIKVWTQKPYSQRSEVDLRVLKVTQGESEKGQWVLDSNGKLQQITNLDEAALKRREVKRRMGDYEFADPKSTTFAVTLLGVEPLDSSECYVIKITNNINGDTQTNYIDTKDFLLRKSVSIEGESSNESYYSDYREVAGLKVAFFTRQISLETGQEQELTITRYESNPRTDPSLFEPPAQAAADFRFAAGNSAENIPFKFRGNHLYIPVVVAGQQRWWVLDTGAAMSVIDRGFADDLALTIEGDMKGKAANSTVDVQFARLPAYSIKGIEFSEQTVAVIDMTELNRLLDIESVGILGFDFLSRFVTKVDYANETVSFYDPAAFEYNGNGREVDVHMKNSVFMASAVLDGSYSGTWLIDLGASSVSLNGIYALRGGLTQRPGVERLGRGAGSSYVATMVRCDSLRFAGFTINRPVVSFSTTNLDSLLVPDELGIIGNTIFRHFVLYIDYAAERMIVEPGRDFGRDFPEDRSGLQISRAAGGAVEVVFVAPRTPSAQAGFQKGDLIKSIDGMATGKIGGLSEIRGMFMAAPDTAYRIVVERNGGDRELTLTLADLL